MRELSLLLFALAIALGAWDLLFRILSYFYPTVKLFKALQVPDWKWPWK